MTLTLRIENYDILQDGGPAEFTANQTGFTVGRSGSCDWVLPDPARYISSSHFEVNWRDGAYWLTDISTNGTFLSGQRYRLDGPHRLAQGDRFQIGHYIVIVAQAGAQSAPYQSDSATTPQAMAADPWAVGFTIADPVDPMPASPDRRLEDFSDDFIAHPGAAQSDDASPFGPAPTAQQSAPRPRGPMPADAAAPLAAASVDNAVLRAFCEGAGLPADAASAADPAELARDLGRAMRMVTAQLMTLLKDRASAKQFTKGGARTMMGHADNNPLKFLPDDEQAFRAMFLEQRDGFMAGGAAVDDAFGDIRRHQAAIFAAIQPALIKVLAGLSPEEIETAAGTGRLGAGRKPRSWDTYVERWDARTANHENGMLDEFLRHFAENYAKIAGTGPGQ